MSFLSPLFLAGAAAAAVPIVLHLLRNHTERRVRFAAVALLKGAPVEHSLHRRLRQWLLLALRVATLALVAMAFARPFFHSAAAAGRRLTVVAIDTSLSMSAPSRFVEARRRAQEAIRAASGDVAVVTFSGRATVAVAPTSSRGVAASAIDATMAGFGSTNYRSAFAAAGELFRGRPGKLVIVTDLQAGGWDEGGSGGVSEDVQIELQDVGALTENVAVTDIRTDNDRIAVVVQNFGSLAKDARVTLTVDGKRAGGSLVQISPRDEAVATFAGIREGSTVEASVDDPRGIGGDNSRFAFLDTARASVLVVTTNGDLDKDAWYLRHALVAVNAVRLKAATTIDDHVSQSAAVVVLSSRGLERRARERLASYVNSGGGVVIAAGPDVDGEVISDVLGPAGPLEIRPVQSGMLALAPADVRHPIFQPFGGDVASLSLVRFRNTARVSARSCQTIARFTSGDAAVLDCGAGAGRAVVVASDLNNRWNDFPIRASFVPFVDRLVRYVSNARLRGGEYLVDDVPPGVDAVPGVATVDGAGGRRRVIVNVNPRESDLARMSADDFQASVARLRQPAAGDVRAELSEQEGRQHVWQYLMAAALLALLTESVVAARAA
jgi:aerotolerance regulator-like protein/VWA domain-containing protein